MCTCASNLKSVFRALAESISDSDSRPGRLLLLLPPVLVTRVLLLLPPLLVTRVLIRLPPRPHLEDFPQTQLKLLNPHRAPIAIASIH